LKRAAEDVTDQIYPKIKNAVSRFAKKALITNRLSFSIISSTKEKVSSPESILFSKYAVSKQQKRMKFIFKENLSVVECEECIEQLFGVLQLHYKDAANDDLYSIQIANLANPNAKEVYFMYDKPSRTWKIVDPMEMVREQHQRQLKT
jgi:hypothetical protein